MYEDTVPTLLILAASLFSSAFALAFLDMVLGFMDVTADIAVYAVIYILLCTTIFLIAHRKLSNRRI